MTSGAVSELPNPRRQDSPRKAAAKAFAIVVAGGLAFLLLAGGHPRSNWYYPFIVTLAGIAAATVYRRTERQQPDQPTLIETKRASLRWTAISSVIFAGLMMLAYTLLGWDLAKSLAQSLGLGLFTGVVGYRTRRGLPSEKLLWQFSKVALLGLLVMTLFVFLFVR
jgi:hypothetical protein